MKTNLIISISIILIGCTSNGRFESLPCFPGIESENDNLRHIFKPCRQFIYEAKYWDEQYNLISNEKIWMMATGNDWEPQPESQDEIIIQYSYDEEEIDRINTFNINNSISHHWENKATTGVIENSNNTWMHPFRQNQYNFTEIAPFPSVTFPLEDGRTWESFLNIHEGWGDWSDTELKSHYQIIGKDTLHLNIGTIEAWHISSIAYAAFGNTTHDFWYNNDYGFMKMIIKNYNNQLLKFELIEVIE
ncbi:MAG: hypothetical protein ABJO02_10640 [Reichenbachiella sp.]|uniref:hypothetical protein n=1 Tax=Reichenbachiella sp. TaxID=2184521 RepID=UPI0032976593